MKRLSTNILVDIALFLNMAILSISGFVIKVMMPSGGGMHRRGGFDRAADVLGMSRHTWKDIHLWAGIIVLLLLLLHIALHWKMIDGFFKKNIPNTSMRYTFYVFLLIVSVVSIVPWVYVLI